MPVNEPGLGWPRDEVAGGPLQRSPVTAGQRALAHHPRHRGNVWRLRREESTEPLCPFAGVVHADARGASHAYAAFRFTWALDPELLPLQIDTVQRPIDVHGAAEQARAPGLVVDAFNRLQHAQKHCLRHAFSSRVTTLTQFQNP